MQLKLAEGSVGLYSQTNTAGKHQQHGSRTGICRVPTQHTEQTRPGSASFPQPAALPAISEPAPWLFPNPEEHPAQGTLSSLEAPRSLWQLQRRPGPAVKWRWLPSWHPRSAAGAAARRAGPRCPGASPERQGFKGTGKAFLEWINGN